MFISDFSVHIKNLNLKGTNIYQELSDLIIHIEKVISTETKITDIQNEVLITDINYPIMADTQISLLCLKNSHELERIELDEEYKLLLSTGQDIKEIKKKLNEKDKILSEITNSLALSLHEQLDDTDDVFITFKNHVYKKLFKNAYQKNICCKKCSLSY